LASGWEVARVTSLANIDSKCCHCRLFRGPRSGQKAFFSAG